MDDRDKALEDLINDLLSTHLRLILSASRIKGGLEAVNADLAALELQIVNLRAKKAENSNGE